MLLRHKSTNLQIVDNVSLGTLPIQNADNKNVLPSPIAGHQDACCGIYSL